MTTATATEIQEVFRLTDALPGLVALSAPIRPAEMAGFGC